VSKSTNMNVDKTPPEDGSLLKPSRHSMAVKNSVIRKNTRVELTNLFRAQTPFLPNCKNSFNGND